MFKRRFAYKEWADRRTLEAIEKVESDSFPEKYAFVLQQVNHIVIVDELFRSRLEGASAPHNATNSAVVPGYAELKERLTSSGGWYSNYVSELADDEPQNLISFVFADGKPGALTVEEILFHVVNHGSYHRGSIAHALDLASVEHPADGYGIFIHEVDPARRDADSS